MWHLYARSRRNAPATLFLAPSLRLSDISRTSVRLSKVKKKMQERKVMEVNPVFDKLYISFSTLVRVELRTQEHWEELFSPSSRLLRRHSRRELSVPRPTHAVDRNACSFGSDMSAAALLSRAVAAEEEERGASLLWRTLSAVNNPQPQSERSSCSSVERRRSTCTYT